MDQRPLTGLRMSSENQTVEGLLEGMDVLRDRTSNVYAAVIENKSLLPDDGPAAKKRFAPKRKKKNVRISAQKIDDIELAQAKKGSLALLQEAHALWLK